MVKHAEKRLLKIPALFAPQESHGFYTKELICEKEETYYCRFKDVILKPRLSVCYIIMMQTILKMLA